MSGRITHHAGGAAAGLAVGHLGAVAAGWTPGQVLLLAATATVTAGGKLSPDLDQSKWWRRMDRWLPDEWLGGGGPLAHRNITHWWGTTVALAAGWATLLHYVPKLTPLWPVAVGHVVGWLFGHLALDLVFGKQVHAPDGGIIVRRGIPMMPWWAHRGGLARSGDIGSQTAGVLLWALAATQVAFMTGLPSLVTPMLTHRLA